MAKKNKSLPLFLVFVLACLVISTLAKASISPQQEFEKCQDQCQQQQHQSEEQHQICTRRCEEIKKEREREETEDPSRRGETGGEDRCKMVCQRYQVDPHKEVEECVLRCPATNSRDPEEKYRQCQVRCQKRETGTEKRRECMQECQKKRDNYDVPTVKVDKHRLCKQVCERVHKDDTSQREGCEQECLEKYEMETEPSSEQESGQWNENPYHFPSHKMQTRLRSSDGSIKVLYNLKNKSNLLKGIQNYGIAVLETAPGTIFAPHHLDADSILVVTKGKGTVSIVRQNKRESYNVEVSDMIVAEAGSTLYFLNQQQNNNNEPLQITLLLSSINLPGLFEAYYPGGGETPQSYFQTFSRDILKQSLSASEEQIERLVGEQRGRKAVQQRVIVRASEEQLKALSQHATSAGRKGGKKSGGAVINLQNLSPLYSNEYGKFFEANPKDIKQLQEINALVGWAELKQGTIWVPHFNSKATILVKVVEGSGRVEMGCPHLQREQQRQQQQQQEEEQLGTGKFQKVTSTISRDDIFIIPAGHPVSIIANEGQNLRLVGFGVNAINNERVFLAGKENLMKQIENEAKELVFNMPGSEVEEIFNLQKLSHFVPQRNIQKEESESTKTHPLNSILNFAGFA